MSVPSAQTASPAATAAAEPPLEPPGTASRSHGLCTGPNAEFSFEEPIANSSQFVLPSEHGAGAGQPAPRGAVVRRHVGLEDPRAARRADAARGEHVLQRDRDPGDAALRPAGRRMIVSGRGLLAREVGGPREERVDTVVDASIRAGAGGRDLGARGSPARSGRRARRP